MKKPNAKKAEPSPIVKALEFVSLAQRDTGAPFQTHVRMGFKTLTACDGVLTAGHLIDEDIRACPHSATLLAALKKCSGALALAQVDAGRLSVKSGNFQAYILCSDNALLTDMMPDVITHPATDALREALQAVSPLIAENAQRVIAGSALLRAGSVITTNGHMILEAWHGLAMPGAFIVPKAFITALSKVQKTITGIGGTENTLTVQFDDQSWLKTQLYKERWPDCDGLLNRPSNPVMLPEGFFDAFDHVKTFVNDNHIRIRHGFIASHNELGVGARFDVPELQAKVGYNLANFAILNGIIDRIDFVGSNGASHFFGNNLRGLIAQDSRSK